VEPPLLVVVTGPPAAGKTTIARELAARLRVPLIAKDSIKEALFDALGTGDLAWSQRLGEATYLAMLALAEGSAAAGASVVLEANFVRGGDFATRLAGLSARFVQVHCGAPLDVLLDRYRSRERHPGHVDSERIDALREAVETGRHDPLDLPGETIRLDTSGEVDLAALGDHLAAVAEGRYHLPSQERDDRTDRRAEFGPEPSRS
jgi:predicted kinase